MAYEVEQKFMISADTRKKLAALGATKKDSKSFTDIYYDTNDYSLTFNDYWLRQRNGSWELKSPLKSHSFKPLTDIYKETENEDAILYLLNECGFLKREASLQQLIDEQFLVAISEFTTFREIWLLPSDCETEEHSGGNVVLDRTNEDYQLGEVELMVDSDILADRAEEFVKKIATEIGMYIIYAVKGLYGSFVQIK